MTTCTTAMLLVITSLSFGRALAAVAQSPTDWRGRVYDADTRSGIPNLEVKLTPPKGNSLPIRVTSSGPDGAFSFSRLAPGRYLLELSQGVNLLYRAEIDTRKQARVDVALKRRRH